MGKSEETVRSLVEDPAVQAVELKITAREEQEGRALGRSSSMRSSRSAGSTSSTPQDLTLVEAGLVLRARLVRDGADDSTVKLRPVVPDDIAERFKRMDGSRSSWTPSGTRSAARPS